MTTVYRKHQLAYLNSNLNMQTVLNILDAWDLWPRSFIHPGLQALWHIKPNNMAWLGSKAASHDFQNRSVLPLLTSGG
jgi:hypothetical protein